MIHKQMIGFEVKSLNNMIRRSIDLTTLNDMEGLTEMQGWIIGYIYHHVDSQETFQRDLEKEFKIRRSTATGILQLMEKNGLITREPVEYDARLKRLSLTPKAVKIHEKVERRVEETEKKLRNGLSDEEITQFFFIVDKIKRNLD